GRRRALRAGGMARAASARAEARQAWCACLLRTGLDPGAGRARRRRNGEGPALGVEVPKQADGLQRSLLRIDVAAARSRTSAALGGTSRDSGGGEPGRRRVSGLGGRADRKSVV